MNAFHIKIIALITMLIDHIGLFFFPESYVLRAIGRLSFPLFAWLIANGAFHTKNINKYFLRLLVLAIISQFPYMLVNQLVEPNILTLNIFFTLSIGLGAIILIKKTPMKIHWVLVTAVAAALATAINTDYGGFGVLSIVAFYIYFKNYRGLLISQIWIYFLMSLYFLAQGNTLGIVQLCGLISLVFIHFYNHKEGIKMQYLFYLIYPVHYLIIYFLLRGRFF